MDVIFEMPFLTLSNVKINFNNSKLELRLYTTINTFPTTRQVELIWKNEFVAAVLDPKDEIFVIYVIFPIIFNEIHFFL